MLKKAFYLILFLCFACAFGAPVSFETAEATAKNYLSQNGKSVSKLTTVKKKRDASPFFVFSKGAGNGFVIVAANDAASPIFCETDEGDYDENKLPPAFFWMMENYENYINDAEKNKRSQDVETKAQWEKYSKPSSNQTRGEVRAKTFLLTTKWDQVEPFNLLMPRNSKTYAGESCSNVKIRAYAGCVSVSMAQIMKYHKYPAKITKDIPSYQPANGLLAGTTVQGMTVAQGTFDYNNMLDSYDSKGYSLQCVEGYGNGGTTQEKAMANLMLSAALSYKARFFNQNGTGGYIGDEAAALRDYFGYDVDNKTFTNNSAEQINVIADNINRNLPMVGQGGGHTYNIDGYDPSDKQIHVNYGYGQTMPGANGWYAINAVNYGSYRNSPGNLSYNIKPKGTTNPTPTPTNCTITFNSNGGSAVSSATVAAGTAYTITAANPTKSGSTFDGWYTNSNFSTKWTNGTVVNSDITLYAKWNATATNYTVTFNSNGGSAVSSATVAAGTAYTPSATPTRTGCTFDGWYTASDLKTKWTDGTAVNSNITLFAKWNATITFDAKGGSVSPASATVQADVEYTLPTPTKSGFTFDGWCSDANATVKFSGKITANITLYAKWNATSTTPATYTVTLNARNGSNPSAESVSSSAGYTPTTPARTGCTFDGWHSDSTNWTGKWTNGSVPTGNMTLFAKWNARVSFTTNGGNEITQATTTTERSYSPPTPTRTGFTFAGWFTNANFATAPAWSTTSVITRDTTLFARWNEEIKTWTISFDLDGGEGVQGIRTVMSNDPYYNASDDVPTKAGFTFAGWFANAGKTTRWTSATKVTDNATLYAKWESGTAQEYTYNVRILYYEDYGDGDYDDDWKEFSIEQVTVTATNPYWYPNIPGNKFDGAFAVTYVNNKVTANHGEWKDGVSKLTQDTTLAIYELKRTFYVITFEKEYREVPTKSYPFFTNFVPDAPTKEGFEFAGWFTDMTFAKEWTAASQIVRDTTIYAKWEEIRGGGDDNELPPISEPGPNNAVKAGKSFDGKHGIIAVKNPVIGDFAEFVVKTPENWTNAKLTIYDNAGNVVFSDERRLTINDDRMKWNLRNANARAVAAGGYLAVVECEGASGIYRYYTKFGVKK